MTTTGVRGMGAEMGAGMGAPALVRGMGAPALVRGMGAPALSMVVTRSRSRAPALSIFISSAVHPIPPRSADSCLNKTIS